VDKQEYLTSLKNTDLRPKKTVIVRKEQVLLEDEGSEERDRSELHGQIIKWFLKNPYPGDDAVHAFAQELGSDPDEFEGHIYHVLSSVLSEGLSRGKDIKHDPSELKMGIEVEYEHTTNPLISRKIALDHLAETPDYYTRLKRMEEDAQDYWDSRNDERTKKE
jgi:hypothetical protein